MATPIKRVRVDKFRNVYWQYKCHCGTLFVTRNSSIKNGNTIGCGCSKGKPKHHLIGTITYKSWDSMKRRCNKPKADNYCYYGAKGIKVKYKDIIELVKDIGLRPSVNHSIDRINTNGHYERGNCRWVTKSENSKKCRREYAAR